MEAKTGVWAKLLRLGLVYEVLCSQTLVRPGLILRCTLYSFRFQEFVPIAKNTLLLIRKGV